LYFRIHLFAVFQNTHTSKQLLVAVCGIRKLSRPWDDYRSTQPTSLRGTVK